jgi:hypothetical protein
MLIYEVCYWFSYRAPKCGLRSERGLQRGEKPKMWGVPLQQWVGIVQSWWIPAIWILMKEDPETYEAKRRGLDQKYQAL